MQFSSHRSDPSRRVLRRTALAAASIVALGGVAAGCGDTGSGATPSDPTGPVAHSNPVALTKANFASVVSKAVHEKKSAHVTMSVGGMFHTSGDISYDAGGPQMQMTMRVSGHRMEMRLVDDAFYLSAPGMTPPGKFLKVSTKNVPTLGQMMQQMKGFGPDGMLSMMKKGIEKLDHVGTTTIDGTSYEHYRITVDPSAVIKGLGLPAGAASSAPHKMTEDVYLDGDNLMRRVVMKIQGHRVVLNATDWGKPVHVQAPPKSKIVSGGGLGSQLGSDHAAA